MNIWLQQKVLLHNWSKRASTRFIVRCRVCSASPYSFLTLSTRFFLRPSWSLSFSFFFSYSYSTPNFLLVVPGAERSLATEQWNLFHKKTTITMVFNAVSIYFLFWFLFIVQSLLFKVKVYNNFHYKISIKSFRSDWLVFGQDSWNMETQCSHISSSTTVERKLSIEESH